MFNQLIQRFKNLWKVGDIASDEMKISATKIATNKKDIIHDILVLYSAIASTAALIFATPGGTNLDIPVATTVDAETTTEEDTTTCMVETIAPTTVSEPESTIEETTTAAVIPEVTATEEEIELLALMMLAEAEGESEYGQRLVVDVILNRVDSDRHPNTIYDVVHQKGQFTVWNGRVNRVTVTEEARQIVREELMNRTNYDVIYFKMYGYHNFGTPLFKEGCHYFSGY